MSQDKTERSPDGMDRRQLLTGLAVAGAAAVVSAPASATVGSAMSWDYEADVVCVGSGAAALVAAVSAADQGAKVLVVEKMPVVGGTTAKSGGAAWIPNHRFLHDEGLVDKREDALRYMARFSYPELYDSTSPTLGVPEMQYRLLEAFYDNGAAVVDRLEKLGAARYKMWRMYFLDKLAPDYAEHLPQDKMPRGRTLDPMRLEEKDQSGDTSLTVAIQSSGGQALIEGLHNWLVKHGVSILTEHRVTRIVKEDGQVVGIEATVADRSVRIRARRGVVFGTGGYVHNRDMVFLYQPQPGIMGSCAKSSSTGDFIAIAAEAGAMMGPLYTAWRGHVVLEDALDSREVATTINLVPGDSMILVNKFGHRVVNEKRSYNSRSKIHYTYDAVNEDYPNQYLFMIFDERSLDAFAGTDPFPRDRREVTYIIEGGTIEDLAGNIKKRIETLSMETSSLGLAPDFAATLKDTVARFNGFAKTGQDLDFDRGSHAYDREWHLLTSTPRAGTKFPRNNMPNITMHPFAETGPYYCIVLAAGALDTNGGPLIDENARVLGPDAQPIPGLYGAGNCIASPTRDAYYGAGGTIGPAITFGFIAGKNAAQRQSS